MCNFIWLLLLRSNVSDVETNYRQCTRDELYENENLFSVPQGRILGPLLFIRDIALGDIRRIN